MLAVMLAIPPPQNVLSLLREAIYLKLLLLRLEKLMRLSHHCQYLSAVSDFYDL